MPQVTPEELEKYPAPPLPAWIRRPDIYGFPERKLPLLTAPQDQIIFNHPDKKGKRGEPYWWSNVGPQTHGLICPYDESLVGGQRGGSKLSPLDAMVCTPKGFVRMGDIQVGHAVTDPTTGGSTRVIAVHPHKDEDIWRFTFDDGASIEVGRDHLWAFRVSNTQRPLTKKSTERDFARQVLGGDTVRRRWDHLRIGRTEALIAIHENGGRIRIPLTEPVIFTRRAKTCALDPYTIGLFLGDGYLHGLSLTSADPEMGEIMIALGCSHHQKENSNAFQYRLNGRAREKYATYFRNNKLLYCRSWEKFIPHKLKYGPLSVRLEVLRGLMDTDGTVDQRGRVFFTSTSKQLAEDVQFVIRSLGGKARLVQAASFYKKGGERKQVRDSYRVRLWHPKTSSLFRLQRKIDRCTDRWNGGHEIMRELKSIEYIGKKDAQCITVSSPRGLYVGDDFIVTHNSALLIAWFAMGDPFLPDDDPAHYSYLLEPSYRGLMLRKEYQSLADFVDEAAEFFRPLGGTPKDDPVIFNFKSGAKIYTNHLNDRNAFEKFRGYGLSRIGIEELTQIEELSWYLKLFGSLRAKRQIRIHNGKRFPPLRSQIMSTANPDGPGKKWVKERFVKVYNAKGNVIKPGTPFRDPITGLTRIFIPMSRKDNPYLRDNRQYEGMLLSQDEATRKAWMEGDWDADFSTFFSEFRPNGPIGAEESEKYPWAKHVIDPVELKPWWYRFGGGDWGYDHPAVFHKCCRSEKDGRIHVYDELSLRQYGSFELGVALANWWLPELEFLPDKSVTIAFSPDAFSKTDSTRTKAEQVAAGINSILGPYGAFLMRYNDDERRMMQQDSALAVKMFERRKTEFPQGQLSIVLKPASTDTVARWSFFREMLRFRPIVQETEDDLKARLTSTFSKAGVEAYERELAKVKRQDVTALPKLQIWKDRCAGLVRCMEEAQKDEDHPEKIRKWNAVEGRGGDDAIDSCFVAGTLIETARGSVAIEDVVIGETVWTRQGLRRVINAGVTGGNRAVWKLMLSDGRSLIGTPEHPVFVLGYGFARLDSIGNGDNLQLTLDSARVHVVRLGPIGTARVYNLSIENTPEYFANGVLVHNCGMSIHHYKEVEGTMPKSYFISERMEKIQSQYEVETGERLTDPTRLAMVQQKQNADYDRRHEHASGGLYLPRASSSRHRRPN